MNQDLNDSRRAAIILSSLRGAAREVANEIPPDTVIRGGIINAEAVDPVTFVMHALAERYAQLGEEARLAIISEIQDFHRGHQENTDDLINRFETTRRRARLHD